MRPYTDSGWHIRRGADLHALTLRFEAKHVFDLGEREFVNPYRLYATDLTYTTVDLLAQTIARDYVRLVKQGVSAKKFLNQRKPQSFA